MLYLRTVLGVLVTALLIGPVSHAAAPLTKMVVAYASISPRVAPLWVAQEFGFFKKNGIEAELVFVRGAPTLVAALTSGDMDAGYTGGTAVLEKVFYTSVLVSDQDRALDFYTNVLGLEKRVENPTPDGPRFLTVGVKGDDFPLVLWPGTPGQAEPAMGRPPASITIETDDCRGTVEELKSRGVEFVSDVLEFPWGCVAQFQDPDGNRLQVREGR